jgi:hypothetical protein
MGGRIAWTRVRSKRHRRRFHGGDAKPGSFPANCPRGRRFPLAYCSCQDPSMCCDSMIRTIVFAIFLLLVAAPTWARRSGRGSSRSASRSAPRSTRARSSRSSARSSFHHVPRRASRSAARMAARSTNGARSSAAKCTTCVRTSNGRIARSTAAKRSFQASHPCPATGKTSGACPGYVVDHIKALKRGGADAPGNMQWQTTAAAKAKDKSK